MIKYITSLYLLSALYCAAQIPSAPIPLSIANSMTTNAPAGCGSVGDAVHLIAWWTTDNNSGVDATGNGNSVAWTGTPSFNTAQVTNGVTLNGTTQFGSLNNGSLSTIPTVLTLMCWINTSATGGEVLSANPFNDWEFCINEGSTGGGSQSGEPCFFNSSSWATCSSTINSGTWHHIAVSNDGTNTKFYIDGSLINTVAQGAVNTGSGNGLGIGCRPGGSVLLAGSLDDIRIYSVVESGSFILSVYNAGLGNCPG